MAFALFVMACGGGGSGGGSDTAEPVPVDAARTVVVRWRASPEAAGYVLHWGRTSRVYSDDVDVGAPEPDVDGTVTAYLDYPGPSGTIFFALTSYDADHRMSSFSNEIVANVP